MTNKQIEIFLRLADNLNFAKTARELYTTQPTVTREIKSLEEEIHVRLFKRDKHSVELTPAGMAFQQEMLLIWSGLNNAVVKAQESQEKFQSSLSIGFCHESSVTEMWRIMRQFGKLYPNIKLKITAASLSMLQDRFERKQLDIVFGMKESLKPGRGDGFELLYKGYWCVVVASDHPLADLRTVEMSDLNAHTLIVGEQAKNPLLVNDFYKTLQRECPDCKYTYCYDMQEVTMLIRAGFGMGIFPQYSVSPMESCHIIPLNIHLKDSSAIDYYAMWHKDRPELHAGQFVAMMQSLYKEEQA